MKYMKGVVITGQNTLAVSGQCPLPEEPCSTGAFIRPLIWSPCTSDAHLCATGCASLPYLLGKAVGHEMCGEIVQVGSEVHDFQVGDKVIVCSVMPVWRSMEARMAGPSSTRTICTPELTIRTGAAPLWRPTTSGTRT